MVWFMRKAVELLSIVVVVALSHCTVPEQLSAAEIVCRPHYVSVDGERQLCVDMGRESVSIVPFRVEPGVSQVEISTSGLQDCSTAGISCLDVTHFAVSSPRTIPASGSWRTEGWAFEVLHCLRRSGIECQRAIIEFSNIGTGNKGEFVLDRYHGVELIALIDPTTKSLALVFILKSTCGLLAGAGCHEQR
jgi:hypothetical protein